MITITPPKNQVIRGENNAYPSAHAACF
jgi:hypothetical protein